MKIYNDIDTFDEDVLMMNRPVSTFSTLTHSILYDSEQFRDGFDGFPLNLSNDLASHLPSCVSFLRAVH